MTNNFVAEDLSFIKQRMDELEAERAEARRRAGEKERVNDLEIERAASRTSADPHVPPGAKPAEPQQGWDYYC